MPPQTATAKKSLVHIGGDVPDPMGSGRLGMQSTVNLERSALGHPEIRYSSRDGQEYLITADVYAQDGCPMEVLMYCPRCSQPGNMHGLRLTSDKKRIDYDPKSLVELGGRINIEKMQCTWEVDTHKEASRVSSMNLCRWTVVVVDNVARDA